MPGKTKPWSSCASPSLSTSVIWRFRWCLSATTAAVVSPTRRRPFAVFGGLKVGPSLVMERVRRTWNVPASRSTSCHFMREQYEAGKVLSEMDRYFVREWGKRADKVSKYDSSTFQLMATVVLERFVKDNLEDVRLALWHEEYATGSWADRYKPTQSWECSDLISADYLQFYLMMTNNLAMRRCENPGCGLPIPATRKNRKFCNPTCRSNMRHYR